MTSKDADDSYRKVSRCMQRRTRVHAHYGVYDRRQKVEEYSYYQRISSVDPKQNGRMQSYLQTKKSVTGRSLTLEALSELKAN